MYSYMDFVWFLCITDWAKECYENEVGKLGGCIISRGDSSQWERHRRLELASLDRRMLYPDTHIAISLFGFSVHPPSRPQICHREVHADWHVTHDSLLCDTLSFLI
jgi:hypothetical protein